LIAGVEVEPAHCYDGEALEPMLDQLDEHERLPESLSADTHYGSDDNVVAAEHHGVDLQSPVSGSPPQNDDNLTLTVDDFVIDEQSETVRRCPNGCQPQSSEHDEQSHATVTVMRTADCRDCAFRETCPVDSSDGRFVLRHTPSQRRLAARRAEQQTDAFRENYAIRAGGESVNSGLKRKTGMSRVRTRGRPQVTMAVQLRCAGWNVMRALTTLKRRGIRDVTALLGAAKRHIARWIAHVMPLRTA
jgi:hypothetical protein